MTTDTEDRARSPTPPPAYEAERSSSATNGAPKSRKNKSKLVNEIPPADMIAKAKDLLVLDKKGESRPFKDLFSGPGKAKRQLIIFVRHFFCGNCQQYVRALCESISPNDVLDLPEATFVTIIGCGRPDLIEMYEKETNCHFPIYADPTRKLYEALGMINTLDMGAKPEYQQVSMMYMTARSIIQMLRSGTQIAKGGDWKQVGGDFLFEDGEVTWCHRMQTTRDHTPIKELRDVLGLPEEPAPLPANGSATMKITTSSKDAVGAKMNGTAATETKDATNGNKSDETDKAQVDTPAASKGNAAQPQTNGVATEGAVSN